MIFNLLVLYGSLNVRPENFSTSTNEMTIHNFINNKLQITKK